MKKILKISISLFLAIAFIFGIICIYDYIGLKNTKLLTKYKGYEITGVYPYDIKDVERHDYDEFYGLTYKESEYLAKNREKFSEISLYFEMSLNSNFNYNLIVKSNLLKVTKSKYPYVYCYNYIVDKGDIKYASITSKKKIVRIKLITKNEYLENIDSFLKRLSFKLNCDLSKNIISIKLNQKLSIGDK